MYQEIIELIEHYSLVVQAFATVLLALITFSYVFLTWKLVHTPYKTFIKINNINPKPNRTFLTLQNIGQGPALRLQVKQKNITSIEPDYHDLGDPNDLPETLDNLKLWISRKDMFADGPFWIRPDEKATFVFDIHHLSFSEPIFVKWRTITGKKQMSAWSFQKVDAVERFSLLSPFDLFIYRLNYVWIGFKSPFLYIRKMFSNLRWRINSR